MNQNKTANQLQLYKSFYNAYPDAILILDEGVIIGGNLSAQKLFQTTKEADLLGKKIGYFTDEEFDKKQSKTIESHLLLCNVNSEISFEWRLQNIEGRVVDTQIIFTEIEIDQQSFIQAIIKDNTEQKQLEQKYKALEENGNEELFAITQALDRSAIISIADKQGKITKINEEFCNVSHYSEKELLGKDHNIVNSGYHPKEFWQDMWRDISRGKTWRADVKNKAKDGSFYWVDTVINPMLDSEGKIMSYLSIRYLITDRKLIELELQTRQGELQTIEEELRQNLEELEAQRDYIQEVNNEIKEKSDISDRNNHALLELNKREDIYTGDLDKAFEVITTRVAKVLRIKRVGIWKYDSRGEAKIISQKQYETTEHGYVFTKDAEIKQKDTPIYFADLVDEKNIIADFAQNHPALVEFVDSYLIPLQINSMLDIPYFVDGKFAGVVCCETQGQYKNWTLEDISFVKGIADIITIATKTKQQLEEQEKVRQNEKLLFHFLDRIPTGIFIINKNGFPFFANEMAKNMLGKGIAPLSEGESIATVYPAKIAGTEIDYPQENLPIVLALNGKVSRVDDMEIIKDSKRVLLEVHASPIRTDSDEIEYAIAIFQDITERKTQELEIKKQNSKLAANEAVLKKTFHKMKLQEMQLKESLDAVQTQEEELRQSMEELEATQEAMKAKQVLIEEAKIALEKQNGKPAVPNVNLISSKMYF
jgi:PAS domain S-box-containing protein